MDEFRESKENGNGAAAVVGEHRWLVVSAIVLLAIAVVAFAYGYHQQSLVHQLTAQASTSNAEMNTLQAQVSTLTAKLNQLTTTQTTPTSDASAATPASDTSSVVSAQSPEPSSPAASASAKRTHTKRPAAKRKAAPVDSKYNKLQAQLDDQEKQLKATQDAIEKNRSDLESSLNSTRDDLNGSIAKTHEELVALEKRGERAYFEFDLSKSKQFQRIGPLTLSLRKADTKHKSYDLAMIVDDNELNKKKVNLYEPIWIHTENEAQPVQIVVNKIDKNFVHGYVSAPRYKPSELAASQGANATVTPVSAKTAPANANPPQQPQPPASQPEQPNPF